MRAAAWGKATRERTAAAAKLKSAVKNDWPERSEKIKKQKRIAADAALEEADAALEELRKSDTAENKAASAAAE